MYCHILFSFLNVEQFITVQAAAPSILGGSWNRDFSIPLGVILEGLGRGVMA